MATAKKTARKTAKPVKKTAAKRAKVVESPRVATTTPGTSEVFSTQPQSQPITQVPQNSVLLFVNGTNKGQIDTTGQALGEFVQQHASRAGIRSFSVYVDGVKAILADGKKPMSAFSKVEIVAKDSRG